MTKDEVDRRSEILEAAVELFGTLGYYGTSLQNIATKVDLTKAGVLHYVGSKEGLLHAVLDDMYDRDTIDITADMVRDEQPNIAEMWRRIVAINAERAKLVHMFSTLSAEALNPDHPAHDYFATREERIVEVCTNIRWHVPQGIDAEQVLRAGFAMMDGVQLRWLRKPGQNLNAMWARCEEVLFPSPQWEGYR